MVSDTPRQRSPKRNLFAFVVENLGTRIIRGELNPLLPFPKEADLLFHRAILVASHNALLRQMGNDRRRPYDCTPGLG
jgi:DNA-binding FadR family transcriptional regulator